MTDSQIKKLEGFVCAMYGYPRIKSVDEVRLVMLEKMVKGRTGKMLKSAKVDLSRMPPCLRCLIPHIKRVNFRVAQWKQSHVPFVELPSPVEHGWEKDDDILQPVWSEGPILPDSLLDLVARSGGSEETEDDDSESDIDDTDDLNSSFSSDEDDYEDEDI